MIKIKKHIAIFLLLVFVIPIGYQPVHIILHHSHLHHSFTHDCPAKHTQSTGPVFDKNKHCFICEYEFTVTNLPPENILEFAEIVLCELLSANISSDFFIERIIQISPRAPPFKV